MADIINLRQARKQKQRDDKERLAAANRDKFGQTKAEKQTTQKEADRQTRILDGHEKDDK